jgi:hypothetical protein
MSRTEQDKASIADAAIATLVLTMVTGVGLWSPAHCCPTSDPRPAQYPGQLLLDVPPTGGWPTQGVRA